MNRARLIQDLFFERALDSKTSRKIFMVDEKMHLTYAEFYEIAEHVASGCLGSLILGKYERVIIEMSNDAWSYIVLLAVIMNGGIAVPVSRNISNIALIKVILDCNPSVVVLRRQDDCVTDIGVTQISFDDIFSNNDLLRREGSPKGIDIDPAIIIYTSGSTGKKKGIVCSHENIVMAAESIADYLGLSNEDVVIDYLPPTFDYGLYQFILAATVGAKIILRNQFPFVDEVIADLVKSSVTVFPLVPSMASRLLSYHTTVNREVREKPQTAVKIITSTGAVLHENIIYGLENLFSNAKIFSMYGLTECKRVSFLDPELLHKKIGSVGKPMPNVEVRVVDDEWNDLPTDVIGNLVVRGRNIAMGYWQDDAIDDSFVRRNSFGQRELITGDMFSIDKDGYMYFKGRHEDIVKCRGHRISLIEIERALMDTGLFYDAIVRALPDMHDDTVIEALVVPKDKSAFCEKNTKYDIGNSLGGNEYIPSRILAVDSLEMNENGKYQR